MVQSDALQLLGQEDGGEELKIGLNGDVLWGRPRPGRGCSAIYGMELYVMLILSLAYFQAVQNIVVFDRAVLVLLIL